MTINWNEVISVVKWNWVSINAKCECINRYDSWTKTEQPQRMFNSLSDRTFKIQWTKKSAFPSRMIKRFGRNKFEKKTNFSTVDKTNKRKPFKKKTSKNLSFYSNIKQPSLSHLPGLFQQVSFSHDEITWAFCVFCASWQTRVTKSEKVSWPFSWYLPGEWAPPPWLTPLKFCSLLGWP